MNSISLQFDRPWMFLALIPALALILTPFFLLPVNRRKSFKKIAPVVIHCIIATLLIIILAGTNILSTSKNQQVVILMDLSDSTRDYHTEIINKAEKIESLIGKKALVGIVAFANDSVYSVELGSGNDIKLTEVDSSATDIASALTYADSLMSTESASRIILLSDGRQTEGDAAAVAYFLCGHNTRIDSMYFDTTELETVEMQIASLSCSEAGYVGEEITVTTEIKSNSEGTATLKLFDNDVLVEAREISINKYSTISLFNLTPDSAGVHSFRAELVTEADTISENNQAYAYANISDQSSVLIICDKISDSDLLAALLAENSTVKTVIAKKAPTDIVKLCNYDEIILMNVDNNDLPSGFDELVKEYVEVYGGSLLAVGGRQTFSFGNMTDTAFEEVLPADFEFTEASNGDSVAIMLVLDASSSMTSNNYWTLAKQGAIKCVENLTENDYVGVISFSSTATINQHLTQATEANKVAVKRTISGLKTGRGTQYSNALNMALSELKDSDAAVKYVLFLSDGEPQDSAYNVAARKLKNNGISLSTIAIGYSSSVLSGMADTGGGRYYSVKNVSDLPNIMLSETEQVAATSYISGIIKVCKGSPGSVTESLDIDSLPEIKGYVGVTAKEEAKIYLTSEDGNVIYSEWNYGKGKAAIFTSDLSTWCADWFSSATAYELIQRITAIDNHSTEKPETMTVWFNAEGETVNVTVSSVTATDDNTVKLTVSGNNLTDTLVLKRNSEGTFTGSFTADTPGVYTVNAKLVDEIGNLYDYTDSAYAFSYSEEYNAFGESGKSLLEAIVSYSGGRVTSDTAYLSSVKMSNAVKTFNPMTPLAIIALILFLADVAIRKIRWKDLINAFNRK